MAEAFLGEIRIWPLNFAPRNWAFCNGQSVRIAQNNTLFSIIGTYYGGDGRVDMSLPDLRGRCPVHPNTANDLGSHGGVEWHTLSYAELAPHQHTLSGVMETATSAQPGGNRLAGASGVGNAYGPGTNLVAMAPESVTPYQNTAQPHNNMQPYGVVNFCICIDGIFPSRS